MFKQRFVRAALCAIVLAGCGAPTATRPFSQTTNATPATPAAAAAQALLQNAPHAQVLETCANLDAIFVANGLANYSQIKHIKDLAKAAYSQATALAASANASADSAFAVAECFHQAITHAFESFDAQPEGAFFQNKTLISSVLADVFKARSQAGRILEKSPRQMLSLAQVVDNPTLLRRMALVKSEGFSLVDFANLLASRPFEPELEHALLAVLPFADVQIPPTDVFKLVPETAQPFFVKLVVLNITKHAFVHSKRMRGIEILEAEKDLKWLEKRQQKCKRTKSCNDQDMNLLRQKLHNLKTTPSGLVAALSALRRSLAEAPIANAAVLVDAAISEAKMAYASEVRVGSFTLREGDVWTQVSQGGFGNFFAELSQTGSFATHSGAVALEWEDGFPLWFTVEMSNGIKYGSIDNALHNNRTFWRPNFEIERGFTAKAVENLDALGDVAFDARMASGIFNEHGKPALYCAELVHFFYKNRFNTKGETYLSPFDNMRTTLLHLNATAQANARKLNVPPESDYFSPESLHYSPHLSFVGFSQSDGDWRIDNDELTEFVVDVGERINRSIAELMGSRLLAPVSLDFRLKVDAAVAAGRLERVLVPLLSQNKADALQTLAEQLKVLPDGPGKYAAAKLFFTYQEALKIGWEARDASGNLPPNWKELAEQRFKAKVVPLLESLFL